MKLPEDTCEVTYGVFPAGGAFEDEYLQAEVWAIDEDGEPIKKLFLCDSIEIALQTAREISESNSIPYYLDEESL